MALTDVSRRKSNRELQLNQKLFQGAKSHAQGLGQNQLLKRSANLRAELLSGQGNRAATRSKLQGYRQVLRKDVLGDRYDDLKGNRHAMRAALKKKLGYKRFSQGFVAKQGPIRRSPGTRGGVKVRI